MNGVPVHTDRADYRVALAELSDASRPVDEVAGAVAVIDGTGRWWVRARAAVAAGAAVLVIAEPEAVTTPELEELRAATRGVAVIVGRSALRPDLVDDTLGDRGRAPVDVVLVDVTCTSAERTTRVRDAVGWIRVLSGSPPRLLASAAHRDAGLAHLESTTQDGRIVPASVSLAVVADGWHGSILRISGLGAVRTDVLIDSGARIVSVETASERGSHRAAKRREESARLTLRRAIDVYAGGEVTDLVDLSVDAALAESALAARARHK